MPLVQVQVVREQVSQAQKLALINGLMELIVNTMGRDRNFTVITVDEIPGSNWFIAGKPLSETGLSHQCTANVQIYVSKGTTNPEEMEKVIRAGKSLVTAVLGSCDPTHYFIINELNSDGWGFDGTTMTSKR